MRLRKFLILTMLVLFMISCKKSETQETGGEMTPSAAQERRAVGHSDNMVEPVVKPPEKHEQIVSPTLNRTEPSISPNKFLSGRTEFLSKEISSYLAPRGFSIDDLYTDFSSSERELSIISAARTFFTALGKGVFPFKSVQLDRVNEIKNYWSFFIEGKIEVSDVQFGKPKQIGKEVEIPLLLFPERREGRIFLENSLEEWVISGLEIDLSEKPQDPVIEKWAPSLEPLPFQY